MPGKQPRKSPDDKIADDITHLRRHLKVCKQCISAMKAQSPKFMCNVGMRLVLQTAMQFDRLISMRIRAHNNPGHTVFACPDLRLHGRSYELTAEPYQVVAIQDRLF